MNLKIFLKFLFILTLTFSSFQYTYADEVSPVNKEGSFRVSYSNYGYPGINYPGIPSASFGNDVAIFRQEIFANNGDFEGHSLMISYNFLDNHMVGIRGFRPQSMRLSDNPEIYFLNQGLAFYTNTNIIERPDVEVFYRHYLFDTHFYSSVIIGSASKRTLNYTLDFGAINRELIGFVPKNFDYETSSRLYGGFDFGYTWNFLEYFTFDLGINVKYSENPHRRVNMNYGLREHLIYRDSLTPEQYFAGKAYARNQRRDLDVFRRSSIALYYEFGLIF